MTRTRGDQLTRAVSTAARPAVLVLVWLLASGAASDAAAQTGQVIGQVVDAGTQRPVAGAVIQITGAEAATDDEGMFRLTAIAVGRHVMRVTRLGYVERSVELEVRRDQTSRIRLVVSETAITLEPLTVDVLSADSARARGAGFTRGVVTRAQLAQWEGTNMRFVDVLRTAVPSVRVRRLERVVGSDICIELRSIPSATNRCLAPAVYLDGVPITNPTALFAMLEIVMIDRIEVVPASEAGVRFGTSALFGALLIDTRRPRAGESERPAVSSGSRRFDWSDDAEGHHTLRVFIASAVGNAVGLALGLLAAESCLHLRQPTNDAIVSDCSLLPTLGAGAAALILPAIGSGIGARIAGQTTGSRGLLAPATVGSAMLILPGFAVALSGKRSDSAGMEFVGRGLILVGAPAAATLADYLFRTLRN